MTEAEWLEPGSPIGRLEAERGWPSARKQRLFAVACCRRILHLLPDDPRPRNALEVAECYADRKAKRDDLKAALARVRPRRSLLAPGQTYADVLERFVKESILWGCHPTQRTYAGLVASCAACAAAYAALPLEEPYVAPAYSQYSERWSSAEHAEEAAQRALLREVCGDPFHPPPAGIVPVPRGIIRLVQAAYDERALPSGEMDLARLAVLSDALEEAGCMEQAVLEHLRSPGPHVRGCWAVDLLLAKE
jgi:hypothetical protein